MTTSCYFCGESIDQKTVACLADDISHRLCRAAGKAVPREERDADDARRAQLRSLPWVAYRTRSGDWSLTTWIGATRTVVLVGADRPDHIPVEAVVFEIPNGMTADRVAQETGGIIVRVWDTYPRSLAWPTAESLRELDWLADYAKRTGAGDCDPNRPRPVRTGPPPGQPTYHALILWPTEGQDDPTPPIEPMREDEIK